MIACGASLATVDSRMLFVPPNALDEELQYGDGLWSSLELERMNDGFVRAVSRALAAGHENPVAASATVPLGRNGSRQLAEETAIGGVWRLFVAAKFDMTAVDVMVRVRAICPHVTAEEVRDAFRRRLFSWVGSS